MVIDGKAIAHKILARLKEKSRPSGALVVVLVGDNPASVAFVRQKEIVARELGIWFDLRRNRHPSYAA
jgi:5,10-methylene-tetrahydrofolate dehydrogenase/methenyl tetrahydrofolate cyclohydrolase